jgi:hypothetical protein
MKSILSLVISCLLLPVAQLHAGQSVPLSIEYLTTKADLVIEGTVVSKTVQRDTERGIYTSIDFQVTEVWKGNLKTNHFTIVHSGGILGEERMETSSPVHYEVGEEIVAFLVLNQRGEGVTIGVTQGKFSVWKDAGTDEKFASNEFHGASRESSTGVARNQNGNQPKKDRLALSELKRLTQGGAQ